MAYARFSRFANVKNEGNQLSSGTPLDASSFGNAIQETIEDVFQEIVNDDINSINISSNINTEISLPNRGAKGSFISWSVVEGNCITIQSYKIKFGSKVYKKSCVIKAVATLGGKTKECNFNISGTSYTDEELLNMDKGSISLVSPVSTNFTLPSLGTYGTEMAWSVISGSTITIANNYAIVTQTSEETQNILKVILINGQATLTNYYLVKVSAINSESNEDNEGDEEETMTKMERITSDLDSIVVLSQVSDSFDLPSTGPNGSEFEWESLNEDFIQINGYTATVIRPSVDTMVEIGVRATIDDVYDTKYFFVTVLGTSLTNQQKAQLALDDITLPTSTSEDITLPTTGLHSSTISWSVKSGYGISITGNTLKVTKFHYSRNVVLTATVTCVSSIATGDFTITIERMTDLEIATQDAEFLYVESEANGNFYVPLDGDLGSTIEWDSGDTSIIDFVNGEAIVTQGNSSYDLPIRAIVTYGTASVEKFFVVRVLPLS